MAGEHQTSANPRGHQRGGPRKDRRVERAALLQPELVSRRLSQLAVLAVQGNCSSGRLALMVARISVEAAARRLRDAAAHGTPPARYPAKRAVERTLCR